MDKVQKTENLILRLKAIGRRAIEAKKWEKALNALSACANVLYEYNQRYKDDEIEDMLLQIGENIISVPDDYKSGSDDRRTVLYYDGFGLDIRGLAISATRAIAANGYKLIYVTNVSSKDKQPRLTNELRNYDVEFVYIDMNRSHLQWALELNKVFQKYRPQTAYFYTLPFDVSGAVVFNRYAGKVVRILSDLTDHAFWIGLNAFDYITNSRAMGAYIQHYQRGISKEKMLRVRGSLYINTDCRVEPLPFDVQKYRYVFGGGALYKTLGDSEKLYYKMIRHIVAHHDDVNFVYAGSGDGSEMIRLMEEFPGRVFLLPERQDFYQIIQGCVFYLNTYPMFGGLMMRFAAHAEKLPVTLVHENDADGILAHQKELGIEFNTYDEIICEIDKLLSDEDYRRQKEEKLAITVFTQEKAKKLYKDIIEKNTTEFPLEFECFDTTKFRQEYVERLDYGALKKQCITRRINFKLLEEFPLLFASAVACKLFRSIIKK